MNDDLNMVRVDTDLWRADGGGGWLAVEGPVARRPDIVPIIRDPQHVLLRPYEPLLQHGSPDIGFVHYSVGTLHGKDPRILYATSLRHKRKRAPGNIVPMDLTIYPGFSMRTVHQNRTGDAGRVHHVSVRETGTGLQVYAHLRGADGKMRPRLEHRVVPRAELGGLIMLASTYVKDWSALDGCGLAVTRLSPGIYDARVKAGFYNSYPNVREHPFTDINGPKELLQVKNYLWQGFFLGQRMLHDQDLKDVLSFYGHNVNKRLRNMREFPDYDGSIRGRLTSLPLDVFGAPGPYRFLHVFTGVLPGGIEHGTSIAAFGEFLPLLSSDVPGKEPLYHEYAMQRYPAYAERHAASVTM